MVSLLLLSRWYLLQWNFLRISVYSISWKRLRISDSMFFFKVKLKFSKCMYFLYIYFLFSLLGIPFSLEITHKRNFVSLASCLTTYFFQRNSSKFYWNFRWFWGDSSSLLSTCFINIVYLWCLYYCPWYYCCNFNKGIL